MNMQSQFMQQTKKVILPSVHLLPSSSYSSATAAAAATHSTLASMYSSRLLGCDGGNRNTNKKVALRSSSPFSFQKRTMFIQTANTPNPESLKFIPGRPVLGSSTDGNGFYVTSNDKTEIAKSPLCTALFKNIEGIKSIYLGNDFITVTKYAEYNWSHLRTPIFASIMDFYTSFADGEEVQVLLSSPVITDTTILDTDDEIVAMIKELLETRIRPAVQEDGGDIHYVKYEEDSGVVYVKLAGSCVGCPSSSVTLKNGVENMLMHYIPEVSGVEALEDEEANEGEVTVTEEEDMKKAKSYEERLRAAGIPFSD